MPPTPEGPIRVFLVDDSPVVLLMLQRALDASPDIEVVGTARHGADALAKIEEAHPKVICTDYHMPVMDGLEFTRQVMEKYPRPILVVSSVIRPEDSHLIFPLIEAGAIDVISKPSGLLPGSPEAQQLIQKIKILSGVYVISRKMKRPATLTGATASVTAGQRAGQQLAARKGKAPLRIVVIGASTGGPQALQTILTGLPASFPLPVLCVQHISRGFLEGMVHWLAGQCRVKVCIARNGETPQPGTVYFPAEDTHLEIDAYGRLRHSRGGALGGHRPAATATFQSAARCYRGGVLGVLLTGMGQDGATGLKAIAEAGGITMAQDEATSVVFGMPKHAIELGAVQHVLPLNAIAANIVDCVMGKRS